jgi:hypothetical protein
LLWYCATNPEPLPSNYVALVVGLNLLSLAKRRGEIKFLVVENYQYPFPFFTVDYLQKEY